MSRRAIANPPPWPHPPRHTDAGYTELLAKLWEGAPPLEDATGARFEGALVCDATRWSVRHGSELSVHAWDREVWVRLDDGRRVSVDLARAVFEGGLVTSLEGTAEELAQDLPAAACVLEGVAVHPLELLTLERLELVAGHRVAVVGELRTGVRPGGYRDSAFAASMLEAQRMELGVVRGREGRSSVPVAEQPHDRVGAVLDGILPAAYVVLLLALALWLAQSAATVLEAAF